MTAAPTPPVGPGLHLQEALSALLDGELAGREADTATAHVAACSLCTAELDAIGATRALVRALPAVDPPFGLIERIVVGSEHAVPPAATPARRRQRPKVAVWLAGAAAAVAMFLLATFTRPADRVRPPVATFVEAHATASVGGDPISGLAPVAVPVSFGP